ncbi:LysR family transcriptional regulator [Epibacterium sp. Ofav1-8]|uniref:LysR family transcriptional regulator n=1 Tax=Epibacterium sp. Ofav1-8 TaxID=2917735 RepID=UPI001EF6BF42|nr:LysR family transcriptional regulator [Epibacterium sp. Ofav1-8]MCG7623410.1 LysR family transcriptional regulator [Epibacterium sp. Ofav1-8]
MKNYRRNLPPLDGLMFFEAAARHMNFSRAAEELLVSQTAVSKRIQQLEAHLGRALFLRDGRRLRLTAEGESLRDHASLLLDFAEMTLSNLIQRPDAAVRIAANSAVSLFWLTPRLRSFGLSAEAAPVEMVTTDQIGALLDGGNDLAILYGNGHWEGMDCVSLFADVMLPVAAPEVAAQMRPDRCLADHDPETAPPLLTFDRLSPDWTNWQNWPGLPNLAGWKTLPCRTYAQSIGRALQGDGIALGSRHLLDFELSSGALVPLLPELPHPRNGYYLAHQTNRPLSDAATRLYRSLLSR